MYEHHDELREPTNEPGNEPANEPETLEIEQIHASRYVSEQDLAMYAAITGRRPVVEIVREGPTMAMGHVVGEGPKGIKNIFSSARNHQKVSVWIRNMSISARRRVNEAALRLAS